MNLQEQINQLHSKADEAKENNNQLKKLLLTQIESNKKIEEFGFIGSKKLNLIKKESRFDGRLGIIPISLHKKCYNKLMKFDELILEDYS